MSEVLNEIYDYVIETDFVKHSKKVYSSYCKHLTKSLTITSYLGMATLQSLIHSFIPDLYENSVYDCLKEVTKVDILISKKK